MSKMIPQRTVDTIRQHVDVSIDLYGIDCKLFILTNASAVETLDIYVTDADKTWHEYSAKVFIEWSPNMYRLKAKGLFVEHETPITVRFGRYAIDIDDSVSKEVDIIKGSYIEVDPQYVPESFVGTEQYELVDRIMGPLHDSAMIPEFKACPRRT